MTLECKQTQRKGWKMREGLEPKPEGRLKPFLTGIVVTPFKIVKEVLTYFFKLWANIWNL